MNERDNLVSYHICPHRSDGRRFARERSTQTRDVVVENLNKKDLPGSGDHSRPMRPSKHEARTIGRRGQAFLAEMQSLAKRRSQQLTVRVLTEAI